MRVRKIQDGTPRELMLRAHHGLTIALPEPCVDHHRGAIADDDFNVWVLQDDVDMVGNFFHRVLVDERLVRHHRLPIKLRTDIQRTPKHSCNDERAYRCYPRGSILLVHDESPI
jgi:hypothetical protein